MAGRGFLAADRLHAVRQAGKRHQTLLDRRQFDAECNAGRDRAGRVLRIVRAAQRTDAGQLHRRIGFAPGAAHDARAFGEITIAQRAFDGDANHIAPRPLDTIGRLARPFVVDADNGGAALLHLRDDKRLDRGVVLDGAMTVEVIRRHVDEHADGRPQRWRQIDLIGRHFDDVVPARCKRLERQRRHTDIAAHLRVTPGMSDEMRGQRRGGRFAVGAGDGHQRTVGTMHRALAAEQFDIADDFDAFEMRALRRPVRRRVGQRHAGRQNKRGDIRPVDIGEVRGLDAGGIGLLDLQRRVVIGNDMGAARLQRPRGQKPRTAQPEDGDFFVGKGGDRNHRSLSVARPASARITATIQKRMTICGSVQPICS